MRTSNFGSSNIFHNLDEIASPLHSANNDKKCEQSRIVLEQVKRGSLGSNTVAKYFAKLTGNRGFCVRVTSV
jgi:hypothetical protein